MTPPSPRSSPTHYPALDGLRGIAIALVLWHHGPVVLRLPLAIYDDGFWRMGGAGWMGVDLFFVLSGFLITTLLLKGRSTKHQLRLFWIRRALRIVPLAFLYLGALWLASHTPIAPPDLASFKRWPAYFLYCANLDIAWRGWVDGSLAILWSLAVEEHFYAVWPLLARFLRPRSLLALCCLLIIAGPAIRWFTWSRMGYPAVYVATWCRLDTLACGGALAVLLHDEVLRAATLRWCNRLALPAFVLIGAILARPYGVLYPGRFPPWFPIWGYSALAIGFAVIVGMAAAPGEHAFLGNGALRLLGRISYGVYVWHYWVGDLCRRGLPAKWPVEGRLGCWVMGTLFVAGISWVAFERRILRWKERFSVEQTTIVNEDVSRLAEG